MSRRPTGTSRDPTRSPPRPGPRPGPGTGRMAAAGDARRQARRLRQAPTRRLRRALRPERVGAFAASSWPSPASPSPSSARRSWATPPTSSSTGGHAAGTGGIDFGALHRVLLLVLGLYVVASCLSYAPVVPAGRRRPADHVPAAGRRRGQAQPAPARLRRRPAPGRPAQPGHQRHRQRRPEPAADASASCSRSLLTHGRRAGDDGRHLAAAGPRGAGHDPASCLFTIKAITRRSKTQFIAQWTNTGMLNAQVEEAFTGHALVKVFGRQEDVEARFNETNEELYEAGFGAQFISGIIQPAMMFLGNLNFVVIAVVGGLRVASGAMTLGDVQAFIQYSRQFTPAADPDGLHGERPAVGRGLGRAGLRPARRRRADRRRRAIACDPAPAPRGRVEFDHVTFSYDPDKPAHHRPVAGGRARPDRRHRRAHRRGQDDPGQPHHALLRARRRARSPSTAPTSPRMQPPEPAGRHRHGAAGHLAVRRDDPGQHRLRQPRRHRGADPRGGPGHLRRPLRPLPARRLRHRHRRRRRQPQRRREAAPHHRPGLPGRPRPSSSSTRPPARSTPAPRS